MCHIQASQLFILSHRFLISILNDRMIQQRKTTSEACAAYRRVVVGQCPAPGKNEVSLVETTFTFCPNVALETSSSASSQ
mmetsp:Transcript_9928/g.37016  ORF Transcript_9928/g.37016 Transcript_9928/m.37016 type:complete len:80 (+) Transcript_9928:125-364(+)